MSETDRPTTTVLLPESAGGWSRRDFIKGVIASTVTVSGVSYFGAGCASPLPAQTGGVERLVAVDIAQTGDDPLIQEQGLYPPPSFQ